MFLPFNSDGSEFLLASSKVAGTYACELVTSRRRPLQVSVSMTRGTELNPNPFCNLQSSRNLSSSIPEF
eukprot:12403231-Karenia_brevis.AAC.1